MTHQPEDISVKRLIIRKTSMLYRYENLPVWIILGWASRKNNFVGLPGKVDAISTGKKKREDILRKGYKMKQENIMFSEISKELIKGNV